MSSLCQNLMWECQGSGPIREEVLSGSLFIGQHGNPVALELDRLQMNWDSRLKRETVNQASAPSLRLDACLAGKAGSSASRAVGNNETCPTSVKVLKANQKTAKYHSTWSL